MIDNNKLLKSITDYLYKQNVRSDCGIESLASDLVEITTEHSPRTDADKVCALLKEIGCQFDTYTSMRTGNVILIDIKSESTISFGSVTIEFYDDGSFKGFSASV